MKRLLLVMIVFACAASASTHVQTKSQPVTPCPNSGQYTITGDGDPFEQLRLECDPNKRLVILDNYVAQSKPKPSMLVYIYPYYVESYNEVKNYPKAIEYADKWLAAAPDVVLRYQALHAWAFAYSNLDSDNTTLAATALARMRQAVEVLQEIKKPQYRDTDAFEAQKRLAATYFHAVAGLAAMKMKDYPAAYDSFRAIVAVERKEWHSTTQKTDHQ
jgi:tetratricopeptide (TPR) repeat protein